MYLVLGGTWSWGVPGLREGCVHLVLGGVPGPGGHTWCGGCTWSWGEGGVPGSRWVPGPGGVPGPRDTWSWGMYLAPGGGGVPGLGGCTWSQGGAPGPGGYLVQEGGYLVSYSPPPVNRMKNWCKNITLNQTSFAGGKNIFAHRVHDFSVRARLHRASLCYDACNSVLITARQRGLCFHRCLSAWGGVCPSACWDTHTPCPVHTGIHTPLYSACWDTVNKRAVRIPLECILVENNGFISNWGCNPLSSDSTVFNGTRIASVISDFIHIRASLHRASLHRASLHRASLHRASLH